MLCRDRDIAPSSLLAELAGQVRRSPVSFKTTAKTTTKTV
jgi:hypothetical protein